MAKWNKDGLEVSSIRLGGGNLSEGIDGSLTWNGNDILISSNAAEKNNFIGMPDYSAAIEISAGEFTAPTNGIILSSGHQGTTYLEQYFYNVRFRAYGNAAAGSTFFIPISKGETINLLDWHGNNYKVFIPLKGE